MTTTRRRLVPLIAGALLALLAVGLSAPRAARAGCGGDVVAKADSHTDSTLTRLEIFAKVRRGADGPRPPAHPSPCGGLSCSRDPVIPLVPPSAPERLERWGWLPPRPSRPAPSSLDAADDGDPGPPSHRSSPPERPPRPL